MHARSVPDGTLNSDMRQALIEFGTIKYVFCIYNYDTSFKKITPQQYDPDATTAAGLGGISGLFFFFFVWLQSDEGKEFGLMIILQTIEQAMSCVNKSKVRTGLEVNYKCPLYRMKGFRLKRGRFISIIVKARYYLCRFYFLLMLSGYV